MGNSIAELKARLAALNRKTNKNPDIWKPRDEHEVRLLTVPGEDFFQERSFHYNIGDAREVLCPKANFGDDCVICDYAEVLRSWKDEKGHDKPEEVRKEHFELFKKIQVGSKTYVPMVERTDGGKGLSSPQWWGLTQNQANQVLEVCADKERLQALGISPDDGERALEAVTSPKKAFDLKVSFRKPGEKGNERKYPDVKIGPKFTPSPLTGDPKRDAELSKAIKPFVEVFPKVPSSEVEKIFAKFMGNQAKEASTEPKPSEEKFAGKGKDKAEKAGTRDVMEAFEEIIQDDESK